MNWLGWIEAFPIAIKLPNLFSAMPRVPFVLLEGSRVFSSVPFCSFCGLIQNLSFCSFAFIIQMENVVIEVPHVFKKNPLKREPYCQYVLEEWWKTSLNGWCMLGIKVNFSIDTLRETSQDMREIWRMQRTQLRITDKSYLKTQQVSLKGALHPKMKMCC